MVRLDLPGTQSLGCSADPRLIVPRCCKLALGPFLATDHDTNEGAYALAELEPSVLVTGQEISTREGDIIGLFLRHAIMPRLGVAG